MSFLKKRDVKVVPTAPKEELPITVQKRDRKFSEEEEMAFRSALLLPLGIAEKIMPDIGTLCYYFRNETNDSVILIIKRAIRKAIKINDVKTDDFRKQLIHLVDRYEKLDEFSRKRPDVFDHLCTLLEIDVDTVWEMYQKQIASFSREMAEFEINVYTPGIITAIAKKALDPKDDKGKELFMRIAGLDKPAPAVVVNDNSVHNTQNNHNMFSNFSGSIRKSEKEIAAAEQRQLEGAKQEFIEAGFSEVRDEEKVA